MDFVVAVNKSEKNICYWKALEHVIIDQISHAMLMELEAFFYSRLYFLPARSYSSKLRSLLAHELKLV